MIPEDMIMYQKHFPQWRKELPYLPDVVGVLSPNSEQLDYIRELFPYSKVTAIYFHNWDLNDYNRAKFDLLVAMNVFHYSNNPDIWFDNVLRSCRVFWMQDINSRKRGKDGGELCNDGDSVRYYYGDVLPEKGKPSFELPDPTRVEVYNDHKGSIHFLAEFK